MRFLIKQALSSRLHLKYNGKSCVNTKKVQHENSTFLLGKQRQYKKYEKKQPKEKNEQKNIAIELTDIQKKKKHKQTKSEYIHNK